jgi:hypothetical protein
LQTDADTIWLPYSTQPALARTRQPNSPSRVNSHDDHEDRMNGEDILPRLSRRLPRDLSRDLPLSKDG